MKTASSPCMTLSKELKAAVVVVVDRRNKTEGKVLSVGGGGCAGEREEKGR